MSALAFMIPLAIFMGFLGLLAFIWALTTGQYDDPDGSAARILFDDDPPPPSQKHPRKKK